MCPTNAFTLAGLPPTLAGDKAGLLSYLTQHHRGTAKQRRATLIVVGYQAVGKTSLLWRLGHPVTAESTPDDPKPRLADRTSTNGIASGVSPHVR